MEGGPCGFNLNTTRMVVRKKIQELNLKQQKNYGKQSSYWDYAPFDKFFEVQILVLKKTDSIKRQKNQRNQLIRYSQQSPKQAFFMGVVKTSKKKKTK